VKARDGETDIYGIMLLPSSFDPDKKYPIINRIYPGPQVGSIRTRSFSAGRNGEAQALAELGFVVVLIDGLGSPFRSKDFHTAWYGNMEDNG
ncbi:MAG TPA: S9 family peptidase, partial [Balneolaceae bacterium]|nr:S9 family peptidase [Balneolaceae bacterium]